MSLPVLDVSTASPEVVLTALQGHGAILAVDPSVPASRSDRVLADMRAFFALPDQQKAKLAIARSPHFRGHSRLHNERDFREQIHFGRELPTATDRAEAFWRLQGPNLWPDDPAWRLRMLEYMHQVEHVGRRLLRKVAQALGLEARRWLGSDPYLLAKCIGYHPQVDADEPRRGVAAHLDFSLLTLTLQDDVGGLEIRSPSGAWLVVPPARGAWLVNIGELLQFVTGDRLVATAHRVVNPSLQRTRCSMPVFVNPSLDTTLRRELPRTLASAADRAEHVHAVLDPASPGSALHYGEREWRRKGEGDWCAACGRSTAAATASRDGVGPGAPTGSPSPGRT